MARCIECAPYWGKNPSREVRRTAGVGGPVSARLLPGCASRCIARRIRSAIRPEFVALWPPGGGPVGHAEGAPGKGRGGQMGDPISRRLRRWRARDASAPSSSGRHACVRSSFGVLGRVAWRASKPPILSGHLPGLPAPGAPRLHPAGLGPVKQSRLQRGLNPFRNRPTGASCARAGPPGRTRPR
jgi:hypothetical protein